MQTQGQPYPGALAVNGKRDGVSLVLPAYNEEERIRETIRSYLLPLARTGLPYEIIVVSDGSDRTPEVARSADGSSVRVLEFDHRLGKGGAVIEGFKASQYERVGFTDADGSLHPDSLASLIDLSSKFDCVFGSRWVPGSVWLTREPRSKEVAGRVFNVLVRIALRLDLRDTQCGAKFFSARFLSRLLPRVYVNNETTDVSFALHSKLLEGRSIETPVVWTNHEGSRFRLARMSLYGFLTIIGMMIANSRAGRHLPPRALLSVREIVERAGL
jgi:glycosyltransferase involved in cell wall biosynthesis